MLLKPSGAISTALLVVGSAVGGAYAYHHYRDADWERRYAEYQRQLQGRLTESERQMQALNTQLGVARARLVTQDTLDEKYQALLTARDADFEKFRREHALAIKSISQAVFGLQQRERGGTETAHEEPPAPARPGAPMASPARQVISYEFTDSEGRVHLKDPNIWLQGDEDLELTQSFQVEGTVMQQTDGSLMTERVQLTEVTPDGTGKYRPLTQARLVDANFTYANAPRDEAPLSQRSYMATIGSSFRTSSLVRFGGSARVLRLGPVGFAGGLSSDFKSLEGSGADAFLTYTPSIAGRELGLVLGGGVHLPLGGARRVLPNLTLSFVVY
ncbi:hypothetical protein HPC49_50345 [Pyxidicoccus fallax]|uniref:Uncharacterized protein n=1 Tax=Pyxidicoccus fallax TaxID=394095 RepID=A0A848LZV0_9BACT|nr:hypothetical protein [Pyxidicoccus fallax]NMO23159.1 hypothetical protein [Pyxidicoccus fallax]NPC86376.1 hypothetical protein [Pyxidicoccus fallax]